jgi:autotransporter-associated beta strand protein
VPTWNDPLGGTWTDSTNWIGGVPNAVGAIANFNISTSLGTTVGVGILETSAIRLGQLNINMTGTDNLTIRGSTADTGTGVGRLIFNNGALDAVVTVDDVNSGSGEFRISAANGLRVELESNTVFDLTTNNAVVIDANIQGSGTLIKDGFGDLELTGANSFTGGIRIDGGELIASATSLGSGTISINDGVLNVSGTVGNTIVTAGPTGFQGIAGSATFTGTLSHQGDRLYLRTDSQMIAAFSAITGNGVQSSIQLGFGTLRFGNAYSAANLFNLAGAGNTFFGQSPINGPFTTTLDTNGFDTFIKGAQFQNIVIIQTSSGTIDITFNDVDYIEDISDGAEVTVNGTAGFDRLIFNVVGDLDLGPDTFTFNNWSSTDLIELNGNAIANQIIGSTRRDFIYGNDGDDILAGGGGSDRIFGGNGNDIISLNADNDASNVDGGANSDTLRITGDIASIGTVTGFEAIEMQNNAIFQISGAKFASGFDFFSTLSGTGSIVVNLTIGDQQVQARGMTGQVGSNIDFIVNGSSNTDIIKGALGVTNDLRGNSGIDQIVGGNLNDIINGGNDGDKIRGDGGADTITGGTGADVFKYRAATDSAVAAPDTITDFLSGTDRLNFKRIDTNPTLAGDQDFTYVGTGAFSGGGTASIRWVDLGANLRVEADVNGDGTADMHVLLLGAGAQTLTAADFVL